MTGNEAKPKMNWPPSGRNRPACDAGFHHPATRSVGWDPRSILGSRAEVVREPGGNLNIPRNGQTLVEHASLSKNLY